MTLGEHTGKLAIVAGGASGIGLATATLLHRRGATVYVADTAPLLDQAEPAGLHWLPCDVRDPEAVRSAIEIASKEGPLDYVIYSAGIQRYGSVTRTTLAEWDQVQDVNVRGLFLTAHFAIPHMHPGASIVAVSSVQARAVQQNVAAYAASKGCMEALIRSIAVDYASVGIRANAVLPGTTDTPMVRTSAESLRGVASAEQTLEQWGRMHPLGRVAGAAEVAEVVAFLVSERASFVTGASYMVDGGLLAALPVRL